MEMEDKIKMFKDVFAPKSGEKILFLIDKPHDDIIDNKVWKDRRLMAKEWFNLFTKMGKDKGFTVELQEFEATGVHNSPVSQELIDTVCKYNLVIAMTEFSASSSLYPLRTRTELNIRCASMPGVERRMEQTAFRANYSDVNTYANNIKKMLTKAVGAEVLFSTGDRLYLDLRNREGLAEGGICRESGQFINFPSGEGFIAPYEGIGEDFNKHGESKTEGILPDNQHDKLIKYRVKNNKIIEVLGQGETVEKMRKFFKEDESHRNIAELGIGCNPKAVVTGNILEDEKVSGLHIAYGMNSQFGGKVKSDMHQDICFPKGLPAAAQTLTLFNEDSTKIELIRNGELRYDLLKS
jgi:leucyl aminopeptidase (aminopeptidase T)